MDQGNARGRYYMAVLIALFCANIVREKASIVHDFRAISAKLRIPATPIPRKEDIFDANGWWSLVLGYRPLVGLFSSSSS